MVILAIIALFTIFSLYQAQQNSSLENDISEAKQAIPEVADSSSDSAPLLRAELENLQKKYTEKQTFLDYLTKYELGNRQGFSEILSDLAKQRIDNVWLTSFSFLDAGRSITLDGKALESNQIPLYIDNLAQAKQFQGKQFSVFELQQPADSKVYTFKLHTNENTRK